MRSKMAGALQKIAPCAKIMLDFNLSELCEFLSKKCDQVTKSHLFCPGKFAGAHQNARALSSLNVEKFEKSIKNAIFMMILFCFSMKILE